MEQKKRQQLKMYWKADNSLEELMLPEGYSYAHYNGPQDIHVWNECISLDGGSVSSEKEVEYFISQIVDYKTIDTNKDLWFIDYEGQHVATASCFVIENTDIGDMHWVGIKKEFRGKGLSKYLCYIVQKTLLDKDVSYVSLTTDEFRPFAVKSYIKAGFLPVNYDDDMVERWGQMLEILKIDSIEMLNDDATPFKTVYRTGLKK